MTDTVPQDARTPQVLVGDEEIFDAHVGGKISVERKAPLDTQRALSIAYTPGVAQVSRAIAADHTLAARYTWAHRLVAVVSDGSAVLGLGDVGPAASLPVMEGKSALFKAYGGLDSIPIVLDTKDPDEIVETLVRLRPTFGAEGIVFALSNPDPEIRPDVAAKHVAVVATGRSDFPNQINNVLAFPGAFRGALDVGARKITQQMMVAAAEAILSVVGEDLAPDRIVPSPLDPRVCPAVAEPVAGASGV